MIDVKHVTILAKYIVENPKCSEQDLIKIMVSDFGLTIERAAEWLRVYISVCAEFFIIPAPTFDALKTTLLERKNDLNAIAQKSARVVEMRLAEMAAEAEKQKRIAELNEQIAELERLIEGIKGMWVQYPECDDSDKMKEAIDYYNHQLFDVSSLETEKEKLEAERDALEGENE